MSETRTIIQVRRDTTANWLLHKDVVPAEGEPCLDLDTGVVKWGDGVTTYENLRVSGSQATHYEGVKQNDETDEQCIDRVLQATGVIANHDDIFVVKTPIADEKYAYTSYVYDGTTWKAMDGNYSATNVIFPADLTITAPTGIYTQEMIDENNGSIIHSAEGKNLLETLSTLFAETKAPTIIDPVVSLTASGSPSSAEVGTKITKLNWNGSFTSGSYEYGSVEGETKHTDMATGITGATWKITNSIDDQSSTAEDGAFTLTEEDQIVIDTVGSKTYATISWEGTYADSPRTPVNNIGVPVDGAIVGATKTGVVNVNVTGYRNSFYYVGDDYTSTADSAFIRTTTARGSSTKDFNVNTYAKDGKTKCLTVPGGTKRILIAVPGTATLSEVKDLDGMGLDVKGNFTTSTVQVRGANNAASTAYTVFDCINAEGIAATNYVITIK
ncbi:MAG: hypothetical protein PUF04_09360 [bacterium]|nr:hypothetical protein [bacterium]